jgi:hypothetical protein
MALAVTRRQRARSYGQRKNGPPGAVSHFIVISQPTMPPR